MAKVTARACRQRGLTYYTERLRPASFDGNVDRIYYEAWRLRSDGAILSRLIATWPAGETRGQTRETTEHSGGFSIWRRFAIGEQATPVHLERLLAKIKADVVKTA